MIKHIAVQGLHILFSLSHKATTEIPYSYIPYKPQPPAKLFSLFFLLNLVNISDVMPLWPSFSSLERNPEPCYLLPQGPFQTYLFCTLYDLPRLYQEFPGLSHVILWGLLVLCGCLTCMCEDMLHCCTIVIYKGKCWIVNYRNISSIKIHWKILMKPCFFFTLFFLCLL